MSVYSYKHVVDLSSSFNAFMHSLLDVSMSDLITYALESTYMACNVGSLVISCFSSYFSSSSGSSQKLWGRNYLFAKYSNLDLDLA